MKKILLLTLIALLSYGTSLATIKYVTTSGSGSQDGSSWANANINLINTLSTASSGDTIWVAKGTYRPGITRNDYFEIKDSVKVFGGFAGNEPVGYNLAFRDFSVNETILSGNIGDLSVGSDNSYHVVYTQNVSAATVLDGFTIQDGNANNNFFPEERGGGWFNTGRFGSNFSNPTINNCVFKDNYALNKGGALCNDGYEGNASPILTNCTFSNNSCGFSTVGRGGAIYNEGLAGNSNPEFINCSFYENRAYQGGGVFNDGNAQSQNGHSNPTFLNCTFYNNGPVGAVVGQAIYAESADDVGNATTGESITTLKNTIIWGENSNYTSFAIIGSSTAELYASLVREIDCAALNTGGLATFHGNGNLFAQNPIFVDSTNGNLQLQTIGAAYNAGDNSIVIEVFDINNGLRIRDTQVDMGAYEYDDIPIKVYVDASKTTGDFKGYSWANAFTDLQDALSYSKAADAIWVAEGTYKPTSTSDRTISFVIPDSVKVFGGFAGIEATNYNLDLRDFTANETILSGDIGNPADSTDNSYHVVYTKNVSHETVVDGITITRGNANGTTFLLRIGGAWYNDGSGNGNSSNPTLTNCTFTSNTASVYGGAMYNDGENGTSNPTLTNCTFTSNTAAFGGAMYNLGKSGASSPTLTNCTFTSNTAALSGGAIYWYGDDGDVSSQLTNCIFNANGTEHLLYDDGDANKQPTFTNCTFYGATTSVIVTVFDSGLTPVGFTNCIFWGNNGDIADDDDAHVNITYSIVEETAFTGVGNIYQDPLFVDAALGDFSLQISSPAINVGLSDSVKTTIDLAGDPRIKGTAVDMGAFENQNGTTLMYVDYSKAAGNNNGSSWAHAFTNMQDALAIATPDDSIWVAKGTYKPTNGTDRDISFEIPDSVKVYGGFAGV